MSIANKPELRPGMHVSPVTRQVAVLSGVSTLAMLLEQYNALGISNTALEYLVLYLLVPLLAIRWGLGQAWSAYGLGIGNWRQGLALTGLSWLVATGVIAAAVRLDPQVRAFYQEEPYSWVLWLENLMALVGWEFLFRGFLLFGYARLFGFGPALWLQMAPFALMHLRKPALETYSTLLGGLWLGYMAWRSRSVLYPILAHTFFSSFVVWAAHALP